jgi:uncharacterized membrane protein YkvA (DUF1232 family)
VLIPASMAPGTTSTVASSMISMTVIEIVSGSQGDSERLPERQPGAEDPAHGEGVAEDDGEHDGEHDRGEVVQAGGRADDHAGDLAEVAADALAIVVGRALGKRLPENILRIGAAALFLPSVSLADHRGHHPVDLTEPPRGAARSRPPAPRPPAGSAAWISRATGDGQGRQVGRREDRVAGERSGQWTHGQIRRGDPVQEWLTGLGVAAAVMVASWLVLIVSARRLPAGTAKELARFLPACLTTVRRLRRNPAVPRRAKIAVGFAGLWMLSPIDLIPEFLPVIGPLDDVVVVALALRYAARQVPRAVLLDAWPGDRRIIERLLGATGSASPDSFVRGQQTQGRIDRPPDTVAAASGRDTRRDP